MLVKNTHGSQLEKQMTIKSFFGCATDKKISSVNIAAMKNANLLIFMCIVRRAVCSVCVVICLEKGNMNKEHSLLECITGLRNHKS